MGWQEASVLIAVSAGATVVAVFSSFDPLAVYTGVLAWGARGVLSK